MNPIVILGTGLAAYTVARELRKLDKEVPLTLITTDNGHFYSKPMLSNAFVQKKTPETLVTMSVDKMVQQLNAEILTETTVSQINAKKQVLYLGDKKIEYSQLVLALGADPIRLPFEGDAANKVLSVNTLIDYSQFYNNLKNAKRVVIMGAGLIGCEFANDLREGGGFEVSLIDLAPHALGRLVPKEVGETLQTALADLGINLYFNKAVTRIDQIETAYRLSLTDNSTLEADVILSAIGLRPRTKLAESAGLSVDRGIVVDRYLKTNADNIYALGDCAQVEGLVLPYVMPLMAAGRALAKTLVGKLTAVSYPAMPVVVKTPACPIVVSPPAMGTEGKWQVEVKGAKDVRALFYTPEKTLAGFVLTGVTISEKNALAKELPPLLA